MPLFEEFRDKRESITDEIKVPMEYNNLPLITKTSIAMFLQALNAKSYDGIGPFAERTQYLDYGIVSDLYNANLIDISSQTDESVLSIDPTTGKMLFNHELLKWKLNIYDENLSEQQMMLKAKYPDSSVIIDNEEFIWVYQKVAHDQVFQDFYDNFGESFDSVINENSNPLTPIIFEWLEDSTPNQIFASIEVVSSDKELLKIRMSAEQLFDEVTSRISSILHSDSPITLNEPYESNILGRIFFDGILDGFDWENEIIPK
ncbi:hypothetical protein [Companilactobacillus mishanensis]|uniref:Uncharacterized protein n=1 Tax=Companilactobacillus mishanensis TaxID=2486008 RepID=A0ABW9P7G8_9LACO|nr:hypothetical protein [Companilactobacillus mishanensis]MQS45198.1 hypothetical protein [Companilactobacillus mishanensis]